MIWNKKTNIIVPFDASLEFRETKVNLDAEHYSPVSLAILALFWLSAATQRRQIGADYT